MTTPASVPPTPRPVRSSPSSESRSKEDAAALRQRMDYLAKWGGGEQLSAPEAIMWHLEKYPASRSSGTSLHFLDGRAEWSRVQDFVAWLCAATPRLRQRVREAELPGQALVWVEDQHFDLGYHLRHVSLPAPAGQGELQQFLQSFSQTPFDPARPPWEAVLIDDCEQRGSVFALKIQHCLTDGGGLIQLFGAALSPSADEWPKPGKASRPSTRGRFSRMTRLPGHLGKWGRVASRALAVQRGGASGLSDYLHSLQKLGGAQMTAGSPLLKKRSRATRYELLELPMPQFKRLAKAAGASVNDLYLAIIIGGMQRYHQAYGVVADTLPLAFPVSVRKPGDPEGGNRFTAVNYSAPLQLTDPAARIAAIQQFVQGARREPALDFINQVMPALLTLPKSLLAALLPRYTARLDLQASNIPGLVGDYYLAGRRVRSHYVLPPRPGCAVMLAMISHNDAAGIALNCDPAAILDPDLLVTSIREEFEGLCQCFLPPSDIEQENL